MNKICYACGSDKTYIHKRDNKKHWHPNKPTNLYLCNKCYFNYIINPIRNPIIRPFYKPRYKGHWLHYKDRVITLKDNPRKGICSNCGFIGKTHMHHKEYHDDDVLKDTVELCHSCHTKIGWELGSFDIHKGLVRPRNELGWYIKQSQ